VDDLLADGRTEFQVIDGARERGAAVDSTVQGPGTLIQRQIDALLREACETVGSGRGEDVWSWHSIGGVIELRAQLPPTSDPLHRSLMLDGGSLLLNLRLLIRGLGVLPAVRAMPDPERPDLVAEVRLDGPRAVTEQDRSLVAALLAGPPNWSPADAALTMAPMVSLLPALRRAAKAEQAWLAVQPMTPVKAVDGNGGMPSTLEGTVLIVGTVLDGPAARLQAGQAAQRVVLTAAALGVPITPLRSEWSTEGDRRRVRELIGGGLWPQAVLHPDPGSQPLDPVTY
jgi:hypothetical protein